jgi:hypothetical protein
MPGTPSILGKGKGKRKSQLQAYSPDMTEPTSPDEQKPGTTPDASQERLLQFSPAEIRLLIITIIGTVAGALIAALIIGLALWFIRTAAPSKGPVRGQELQTLITASFIIPIPLVISWYTGYGQLRPGRFFFGENQLQSKWGRRTYRIGVLIGKFIFWTMIPYVCVISIAWVGIAAGISK